LDFSQTVRDLANRSKHAAAHAQTEQATKTSVVLPFIQALGFDVFNLEEVVPEFVADVGIKKGEKIDFAIKIDKKIAVLIEVKPITATLGAAHINQLYRYFAVTEARLGILTNGREFWFFSDLDEKNKMDNNPFFVFDLQSHDQAQTNELARFQKSGFALESILEAASKLSRVKSAAAYLKQQLTVPDDDFVRLVGKHLHNGSMTKSVVEGLRQVIQSALDQVIRDRIQDKLNITFAPDVQPTSSPAAGNLKAEDATTPELETTAEEQMAFMIVRAIAAKLVPVERITLRDAKSYCAVFMDDNNRKPICRFYFNTKSTKAVGLFDADKVETRHHILSLSDIYKFAPQIEQAINSYS
jgi:hypothetical protein